MTPVTPTAPGRAKSPPDAGRPLPGPPFIGLTGGIAAGKSAALAILERLGAATISADAVVHDLLGEPEVRERLIEHWGARIAPGGDVDRGRIAAIVFAEPAELEWLEVEMHPRVGERIEAWRGSLEDGVPLAVVEVPLLFESGMEGLFDAVLCVVADDGERVRRARRRGLEELEGRGNRQLTQEEKAARSSYVVQNDGTLGELESELRATMATLVAAGR